jgi:hypothetical protein
MKQFLLRMFSDKSDVNSKAVIGFTSFIAMVIYGLTDVVTGAMGKDFVIEPLVFDGLKTTAWVMLGISGVEAVVGNKNLEKSTKEPETEA